MTFNPNSSKETPTSTIDSSTSNDFQQENSNSTETSETAVIDLTTNLKKINISETQGVRLGKCKWFNVAKGWGFITPNDGGQEIFVHQSVIQMDGFRSLGEQEHLEFECKLTERGLEATRVSGIGSENCVGSTFRPRAKKRYRRIRCYNCGQFANHIASKCLLGPQPKRCHNCKSEDHLVAECPVILTNCIQAPVCHQESSRSEPNDSRDTSIFSDDNRTESM